MTFFEVTDMKPEKRIETLRAICKALISCDDSTLEENSEELLSAMMDCLDSQDQNDAWGTEGWQHYMGFE